VRGAEIADASMVETVSDAQSVTGTDTGFVAESLPNPKEIPPRSRRTSIIEYSLVLRDICNSGMLFTTVEVV